MKSNHYVPDKQFRERDRSYTSLFSVAWGKVCPSFRRCPWTWFDSASKKIGEASSWKILLPIRDLGLNLPQPPPMRLSMYKAHVFSIGPGPPDITFVKQIKW